MSASLTGYQHPAYAESLAEFGKPLGLSKSGGWILKRQIPGTPYYDGMSCYPLFACQDWSQVSADLEALKDELVSLSIVTDPFGTQEPYSLQHSFKDVFRPFKQHFVVDLNRQISTFVSSHHRRNARKAFLQIDIEICENPFQYLDEWVSLYENLIRRHQILGISVFSRSSFTKQLKVPGMVMLRALEGISTVGIVLWVVQGHVGYYHLGAYSNRGYELNASFGIFWRSIEYFTRSGLQWLSLGAGAGVTGNSKDGLSRFKSGWATGTKTAYFCGRVFDETTYAKLRRTKESNAIDFFPAYRVGEFDQS